MEDESLEISTKNTPDVSIIFGSISSIQLSSKKQIGKIIKKYEK